MAELSETQFNTVAELFAKMQYTDLQDNLIDHVCCHIENMMDENIDFETALASAMKLVAPDGAGDIEKELVLLLTIKNQTVMKSIMYGAGFIAAFGISTGILFRTAHWPKSDVFMFIGFSGLLVAVSTILINGIRYAGVNGTAYTIRVVIGFLSGLLIASGQMFKMLYFPTANIQLLAGLSLFCFLFLPLFFYQLYRKSVARN